MAENHDINSSDTCSSSNIPESLKSSILTLSVGHKKIATAEEMLILLWQIGSQTSGTLSRRFSDNNYKMMRLTEASEYFTGTFTVMHCATRMLKFR